MSSKFLGTIKGFDTLSALIRLLNILLSLLLNQALKDILRFNSDHLFLFSLFCLPLGFVLDLVLLLAGTLRSSHLDSILLVLLADLLGCNLLHLLVVNMLEIIITPIIITVLLLRKSLIKRRIF